MKILAVLSQNPWRRRDGWTYAVRASYANLQAKVNCISLGLDKTSMLGSLVHFALMVRLERPSIPMRPSGVRLGWDNPTLLKSMQAGTHKVNFSPPSHPIIP